jgi:hypothetical protein
MLSAVTVQNLAEIERIIRVSWGADTCAPDDLADWHPVNPSRGQCGVTALVLNDLFGGDLLLDEVHVDGQRVGHHWWNRFGAAAEVDLTLEQFRPDEVVTAGRVIERPPGPPRRCHEQYDILRARVFARLRSK